MKGCFATILAIIAGIILIVAIPVAGIRYSIFDLQYLKTQLIKHDAYGVVADDLIPSVISASLEQAENEDHPKQVKGGEEEIVSAQEIAKIASSVITEEFLQTTIETLIDELDLFLKGKNDEPELIIDLTSFRLDLIDSLIELFEEKFDELPVCTPSQANAQKNSDQSFPECRPQDVSFDEFSNLATGDEDLRSNIQADLAKSVPEKIDLLYPEKWQTDETSSADEIAALTKGGEKLRSDLLSIRDMYQTVTLGILIAVAVVLFLFLVLLAMYFRNLRTGFRWVGIPTFISGFIVLTLGIIGKLVSAKMVGSIQNFAVEANESTEIAAGKMISLLTGLVSSVFDKIILFSGTVFGAGVILFILSFLLKKKDAQSHPHG